LPIRLAELFAANQSQPTILPEASTVNVKPGVSSQGQASQLMEQAPLMAGSTQYASLRLAELFKFNQSQSTVLPVFVVTNVKALSSLQV
jgi:virulence-associated protein VagC